MTPPTKHWKLPQRYIRLVGTTAADLFELLFVLAGGGIVRGLTVSRLAGLFNAEFPDKISDRSVNAQLKRLADHGLLEIERYSKATKDADLQRRGDIRIRIKKICDLQSKVDFDVGDRFRHEVGDEFGREIRHEVRDEPKTAPIEAKTPPSVQKPAEFAVSAVDSSQKISIPSLYQEHQEQERNPYPQELSRNQEQQEPRGAPPIADAVLRAVSETIGAERYDLWLGPAEISIEAARISIVAKNAFAANWINENMHADLVSAFETVTGKRRPVDVAFREAGKPPLSATQLEKPPEKPREARTHTPPPSPPKTQPVPQTARRREAGGPTFLADALKPAIAGLVESSLPSGSLFRTMEMINLRDSLKKYYDLSLPEGRQALCRVVVCAIELNQRKRLEEFLVAIEKGEVRNPAAYLGRFCTSSLALCNKTLGELDEIGREHNVGKGLWKGKSALPYQNR